MIRQSLQTPRSPPRPRSAPWQLSEGMTAGTDGACARHVRAKERALGQEDGQNGEMGQNEPGGWKRGRTRGMRDLSELQMHFA